MEKSKDYSALDQETFDRILVQAVTEDIAHNGADLILQIPGIYEILAEDYNNTVLDRWIAEKE